MSVGMHVQPCDCAAKPTFDNAKLSVMQLAYKSVLLQMLKGCIQAAKLNPAE